MTTPDPAQHRWSRLKSLSLPFSERGLLIHHKLLPEGQDPNAAHLWGLTEFLPWDWGGQWMRTISELSLQPAPGRRCLHCVLWNIFTEMSNCPSERFGNDFILSLVMNENGGFSSFLQTLAVIYLFLNAWCFYCCFWYGPFFAVFIEFITILLLFCVLVFGCKALGL